MFDIDSYRTMLYAIFIVIFISFCGNFENVESLDIQFDRVEMMNTSYLENRYNISVLRVAKFNRTAYPFNFEGEFFNDIHLDHYLEMKFYYNHLNNNQYITH